MAKIWFVKEGSDPTEESPFRELSIAGCVEKLGLKQENFTGSNPPRGAFHPLQDFRSPRFVDIEINAAEGERNKWQAGFYRLELSVGEARKRLGEL